MTILLINYGAILLIDYEVDHGGNVVPNNIKLVPIEWISWDCLAVEGTLVPLFPVSQKCSFHTLSIEIAPEEGIAIINQPTLSQPLQS